MHRQTLITWLCYLIYMYNGISLLRSPMGLSKSYLNGEMTVLPGLKVIFFALWKLILGLSKCDLIGEVTLLVR